MANTYCTDSFNETTPVGTYTFYNGTIGYDVPLIDMFQDLGGISSQASAGDFFNETAGEVALLNHTMVLAEQTLAAVDDAMDNSNLICKDPTVTDESIHTELRRRLLAYDGHWAVIFLGSSIFSALCAGVTAGIETWSDEDISLPYVSGAAIIGFFGVMIPGIVAQLKDRARLGKVEAAIAQLMLASTRATANALLAANGGTPTTCGDALTVERTGRAMGNLAQLFRDDTNVGYRVYGAVQQAVNSENVDSSGVCSMV